nr:hypothetical protein 4 [Desulfobulbaceae bacterium]
MPKRVEQPREKHVIARLTAREHTAVHRRAKERKQTVSDYVRNLIQSDVPATR